MSYNFEYAAGQEYFDESNSKKLENLAAHAAKFLL